MAPKLTAQNNLKDSTPLSTGSRHKEFRRKITIDLQDDTVRISMIFLHG